MGKGVPSRDAVSAKTKRQAPSLVCVENSQEKARRPEGLAGAVPGPKVPGGGHMKPLDSRVAAPLEASHIRL